MRRGISLIEILVVVAIIAVLLGLLLSGISILRQRAHERAARTTLSRLHLGLEALILEQGVPTTPELGDDGSGVLDLDPVATASGSVPSVAARLVDRGLVGYGGRDVDQQRRLVDPWRQPWSFVVGGGLDARGHRPQTVAAERPAWVPVNADAAPDYRCWVYGYGRRNPDGSDHQAWIVHEVGR